LKYTPPSLDVTKPRHADVPIFRAFRSYQKNIEMVPEKYRVMAQNQDDQLQKEGTVEYSDSIIAHTDVNEEHSNTPQGNFAGCDSKAV
jgi:hypothetical protein